MILHKYVNLCSFLYEMLAFLQELWYNVNMRVKGFSIKNYRSFNKGGIFNFNDDSEHLSLIFGPNGSGKSNFFMALRFMCDYVKNSTHYVPTPYSYYEPFLLSNDDEVRPTEFSLVLEGKKVYRYSFSLKMGKVDNESLEMAEGKDNGKYLTIFRRRSIRNGEYDINGFNKELLHSTRSDSLVITRAYETNNPIAKDFFSYIDKIKFVDFKYASFGDSSNTAKRILDDDRYKARVLDYLRKSDLFIQDISVVRSNIPEEVFDSLPFKDEFKQNFERVSYEVATSHFVRDASGKVLGVRKFNLQHHESDGTRRIFELAAPIIDAIDNGDTLYIDDFDSCLHPKECEFILSLFDEKNNPNDAHLIVNTHCTHLMDMFNRKNIYLFGKNNFEETEFCGISGDSRDTAIQKKYNLGMFGGVPRVPTK